MSLLLVRAERDVALTYVHVRTYTDICFTAMHTYYQLQLHARMIDRACVMPPITIMHAASLSTYLRSYLAVPI